MLAPILPKRSLQTTGMRCGVAKTVEERKRRSNYREIQRLPQSRAREKISRMRDAPPPPWCLSCEKRHEQTPECVPCEFNPSYLHNLIPRDFFIDYRGWRWFPPFTCMGCGISVCYIQWAFSRSCGGCDISDSRTIRLRYLKCFAGSHEKLPTWDESKGDIREENFVKPKERESYPPINRPPAKYVPPETLFRKTRPLWPPSRG